MPSIKEFTIVTLCTSAGVETKKMKKTVELKAWAVIVEGKSPDPPLLYRTREGARDAARYYRDNIYMRFSRVVPVTITYEGEVGKAENSK